MKIIHISDLHIGRKLNGYSLASDQKYILERIVSDVKAEKPDAVVIAGDVYDKSAPTAEAVKLLDKFLDELEDVPVMLISGNHDSADRLSFGSDRFRKSGLYIKGGFEGTPEPVTLSDEYGEVNFYLLPYTRVADINTVYNTEFTDYTEAFSYVIGKISPDTSKRNVMVAHQYVAGAELSESETSIGGIDCISSDVFDIFDYTALGHIHRPQNVRGERIRYCGTPLKYSISEIGQDKSYSIIELGRKAPGESYCDINITRVPLEPERDIVEIKASFDELMTAGHDENGIVSEDFISVVLTDKVEVPDAVSYLRKPYPNILSVKRETEYSQDFSDELFSGGGTERDPLELFSEFYSLQHNGEEMEEKQSEILKKAIAEIWGDKNETA